MRNGQERRELLQANNQLRTEINKKLIIKEKENFDLVR